MSKSELTAKMELFCKEYIIDFNATQAAIRAGYNPNSAKEQGCQNLTKPNIQKRLAELTAERNKKLEIDAQYVLNRLVEIDQMDVLDILNDDGGFKPIAEWPTHWRQLISGFDSTDMFEHEDGKKIPVGVLKKIKFPDKVKNLELLGKHVQVNAFKETKDINVKGINIIVANEEDKKLLEDI